MKWIAALTFSLLIVSMFPSIGAAKHGKCEMGFTRVRVTKGTRSFDKDKNGWVCVKTMMEQGKKKRVYQDD